MQFPLSQVLGAEAAAAAAALDSPPALCRFQHGEAPTLFCYTDAAGRLHMAPTMPHSFTKLLFLLREPMGGVATGHLDGPDALRQLQQQLEGLHLPQVQAARSAWPEQLQQDWAAQANDFCSTLSEAVHAGRGRTVLYVPREAWQGVPSAAARQRELVQRLEVQVLRWTQLIRSLLARQRTREQRAGQEEGPAEEVAFWRQRTSDLGSLRDQLEGAGLAAVLRVLDAARSPHLPAFLGLRGSIANEAEQAASNLVFLEALEAPCSQLAAADPTHLAQALPPLLDACRMVWTLAPHYNTPEQMTSLLRQVSNAVVARCRSMLDLGRIFGGIELAIAEQRLEQCCGVVAAARSIYGEAAQHVAAALPDRPWAFDASAIYAHVEAFVQRCQDLQEICAAQRQFACGQQLAAVLSGSKAPEIARALGDVQQAFAHQMHKYVGGLAGNEQCEREACQCERQLLPGLAYGCDVLFWMHCPPPLRLAPLLSLLQAAGPAI